MITAAIAAFVVLLVAWLFAPGEPTSVATQAIEAEGMLAEAA